MGKIICPGESLIDFVSLDDGKKLKDVNSFLKKAGGAPANAAVAINKFGAEAIFVGAVGNDPFGDFLVDTLYRNGLTIDYVKRSKLDTTLAFVSLDEKGERDFNFIRGADIDLTVEDLPKDVLKESNIFHFGGATAFLGGDLNDTYYWMLDYAQKNNKIISYDPNYRDALFGDQIELFVENSKKFIAKSDILKVSDEEAVLITGKPSLYPAIGELIKMGAKNVFVTIGAKGTIYATKESSETIGSIKVNVVDTTGAGDAFIGAILGQMSELSKDDLDFETLKGFVKVANVAAALTITKKGALESIPSMEEVLNEIV